MAGTSRLREIYENRVGKFQAEMMQRAQQAAQAEKQREQAEKQAKQKEADDLAKRKKGEADEEAEKKTFARQQREVMIELGDIEEHKWQRHKEAATLLGSFNGGDIQQARALRAWKKKRASIEADDRAKEQPKPKAGGKS